MPELVARMDRGTAGMVSGVQPLDLKETAGIYNREISILHVGEFREATPLRDEIMEPQMGSRAGEFEVIDTQENIRSLWTKKEIYVHYLQPSLDSIQTLLPGDWSNLKQEVLGGPTPLEPATRTAPAGHNRIYDSNVKQEMTANIQPPD
jgi:hypothetical protein